MVSASLRKEIEAHFSRPPEPFVPGKTKIGLAAPQYGSEEVIEALDSMLSTSLTMGEKVRKFEQMFADYVGCRHGIMVNSGSSANLLMMSVLTNPLYSRCIKPGGEVITPAITWATTAYPVANVGLTPVFVDVGMDTFDISPDEIRKAITSKTRAIMPVHLLGNPCAMGEIKEICEENNLLLIEDTCEAHGAEFNGRKAGSFGLAGTFSFFFSHHISTIEGGIIVTDDEEVAELARAMRVFGWPRDLKKRGEIARLAPDIDPRYLFFTTGYNFRPTEIQGAFGIHQMPKLENFIRIRQENARYWYNALKPYEGKLLMHTEKPGTRHVWFSFPLTIREGAGFSRSDFTSFLESRGIETRPVMSGNLAEQPVASHMPHRVSGDLKNSRLIMRRSFFWGNHQAIGKEERKYIAECAIEFLEAH